MIENYYELKFHELAGIIPEMTKAEYELLKADIQEHGMRDSIVLYEDAILDGRHRYKALLELGTALTDGFFSQYEPAVDGKSPEAFVLSRNLVRRHLTPSQRAALAAEILAKMPRSKAGRPKKAEPQDDDDANIPSEAEIEAAEKEAALGAEEKSLQRSDNYFELPKKTTSKTSRVVREVAAALHVSPSYIEQAMAVKRIAPELIEQVAEGAMTLPEAVRRLAPQRATEIGPKDRIKRLLAVAQAAGGKLEITLGEYLICAESSPVVRSSL